MLNIGLTGGIGSGKSTVAELLVDHGAVLLDADQLARDVVLPGTDGWHAVVAEFGEEVLAADGTLDRPALGRIVFADSARREALNAIVHPRVRRRAAELAAQAPAGAVLVHDVPLLVETGRAADFDLVLVVDVAPDVQRARLAHGRGMSEEEARSRMAAQAAREERLAAADIVIDNSSSPDELAKRIAEIWPELRKRARCETDDS